jgi:hypothetical protein
VKASVAGAIGAVSFIAWPDAAAGRLHMHNRRQRKLLTTASAIMYQIDRSWIVCKPVYKTNLQNRFSGVVKPGWTCTCPNFPKVPETEEASRKKMLDA